MVKRGLFKREATVKSKLTSEVFSYWRHLNKPTIYEIDVDPASFERYTNHDRARITTFYLNCI